MVTAAGITTVGPRAPLPMAPDVDILSWDPQAQRADIAYDGILTPGTVLIDPRFGTLVVRDVEQTFNDDGARASAWCTSKAPDVGSGEGSKLLTMLRSLTRESAGVANLRTYRYRVVSQTPPTAAPLTGRVTLQAVSLDVGAPHALEVPIWYGVPGIRATITPGAECGVIFLDGDPAQPVVVSFQDGSGVLRLAVGGDTAQPVALAGAVALALQAVAANVGLTAPAALAALAPLLPTIAAKKLFSE